MSAQLSVLEQAAEFVLGLGFEAIDAEVVALSNRAVLNYVGVTLPGTRQPVAQNVLAWALERRFGRTATVIGSASGWTRRTPRSAMP